MMDLKKPDGEDQSPKGGQACAWIRIPALGYPTNDCILFAAGLFVKGHVRDPFGICLKYHVFVPSAKEVVMGAMKHPIGRRPGIVDMWWGSEMVRGCSDWDSDGIPFCRTEREEIPEGMVTYSEARGIVSSESRRGNGRFVSRDYVCFYEDDHRFDGRNGIWFEYGRALEVLAHFRGVVTPDFSLCPDFPKKLKEWNVYRSRAFGRLCMSRGINVVNNVRWDDEISDICLRGIPKGGMICIGAVASGLRRKASRGRFELQLMRTIERLKPHTILVYGSVGYGCFDTLWTSGIRIVRYPSRRNRRLDRKGGVR